MALNPEQPAPTSGPVFRAPPVSAAQTVRGLSWRGVFHDRRILMGGRIAVALAAAATACGFAGSLWWFLDLFAHFRVQYVVAGAVLALVCACARQPRWAVGALAIAAVNTVPIVPLYLSGGEKPAVATGTLRLMSFNVFAYNRDHDRVLEYLRRELPDVLLLQEVTPEWLPTVRELAQQYPHQWISARDGTSGIAMMSRERPSAATTIDLARRGVPSYLLTFGDGDQALSVLGTHLSWPLGRRSSHVRNAELQAIARLAREQSLPFVVLGDLNTTPFSSWFTGTLREGGLRHCVPGAGLTPTWPARIVPLYIQIDHCLSSARVQASNFTVGDYLGSDHYPISVEVAASKEGEQGR